MVILMNDMNPSFVGPNVEIARDFTRHLTDLLRKENGAMVDFVFALAELDSRGLWADMGYGSVFDYLVRELRLSKSAAFYRKTAAVLVQRYPEIADALAEGRLCMTSVGEVAKVITRENVGEILPRFYGLSSREAKEVVAEIIPQPNPPRREMVTLLPVPALTPPERRAEVTSVPAPELILAHSQSELGSVAVSAPEPVEPDESPLAPRLKSSEVVQPLTAKLCRLHVTVTKQWVAKLEAAKDALSHSIPGGSAEVVLEAALDALLEREAKRKGLLVKNPRKQRAERAPDASQALAQLLESPSAPVTAQPTGAPKSDSASVSTPTQETKVRKRHRKAIPAHVRREVLKRDEGKCQAKLHDGSVCGSTVRIELDHVYPESLGGPSTVENIRILCERHNQLAARRVFGEQVLELFTRRQG